MLSELYGASYPNHTSRPSGQLIPEFDLNSPDKNMTAIEEVDKYYIDWSLGFTVDEKGRI